MSERPPRVAWGLYQRCAIAGVVIVFLTAAAVSTAALLKIKSDVSGPISKYGHKVAFKPDVITRADAGKPQTLLLVGSDRRYGAGRHAANSDTLMLVRLDPDQQATAVMSVPRDLVVDIAGVGRAKINSAYAHGGLGLTTSTVKTLLTFPGEAFKINHAVGVNFKGFRRAVDYIHCVYTDVDRRYYHSNLGLPPSQQYAEIDIQPGYQQLCGQDALDYVRHRHQDNDFVRAARQQSFLRDAKDQVGTSGLLSNLKDLVTIFAKSTESDSDLGSTTGILRLLKLAAFSAGHPVRQVQFPGVSVNAAPVAQAATAGGTGTGTGTGAATSPASGQTGAIAGLGDYVTADPAKIQAAVGEFLHGKVATKRPRVAKVRTRRSSRRPRSSSRPQDYGLVDARSAGLTMAAGARRLSSLPLYFPGWLTPKGQFPRSTTQAPMPHLYTLRDRAGRPHAAYRVVVAEDVTQGQFYGVQGTTWRSPPILAKASAGPPVRLGGRSFRVDYDGKRIRLIAWRTPRAVYWVANTLDRTLTNRQMLGLARSLTRRGA